MCRWKQEAENTTNNLYFSERTRSHLFELFEHMFQLPGHVTNQCTVDEELKREQNS